MPRSLDIVATAPQAEFHALECRYPLLVGGYGSGKSETLCNQSLIDIHHGKGASVAIYSPTYKLLRAVLYPRMLDILDQHKIRYTTTKSPMEILTLNENVGDITFHSFDNPKSIVSYNFYRVHVDELDTIPMEKAKEVWTYLIARARTIPKTIAVDNPSNRVCVYTTPEGYGFAYDRWVKNETDEYQRVHASSYSNPMLPRSYIDSILKTYPVEVAKAYIYGQFTNLTAENVYYMYDVHAYDTNVTCDPKETLYVGMDFNMNKMAAVIYVRRDKVFYACDEIFDERNTQAVCDILKKRYTGHKIIIFPDASGNSDHTCATEADVSILRKNNFECRIKGEVRGKSKGKNPRIKDRVTAVNAAFEKGLIKINSSKCPRCVECLQQQAYDPKTNKPDKTSGTDHMNDALGYVIAYMLPIKKPAIYVPMGHVI